MMAIASGGTREAQPPFNHLLILCGRGLSNGEQADGRTGDEQMCVQALLADVAAELHLLSKEHAPPLPPRPPSSQAQPRVRHIANTSKNTGR